MELFIDDFDRPGKHLEKYPEVSEIFKYPRCHWYAPRDGDANPYYLEDSINRFMKRAFPKVPGCVLYNIPDRDCGNFSKGGASSNEQYVKWVEAFARGITPHLNPIIIFEPDALPLAVGKWDEPPTPALLSRIELFNTCLPKLNDAGSYVYVDIGHSRWLSPEKAAEVLNMLDHKNFDGFSMNVSNFIPLSECIEWGEKVSALTNGMHFVIDTSRNGTDHEGADWCNPPGKRLGHPPTFDTGHPLVDAFLWVKIPGESDGYCSGGPKSGQFWPEYAMGLLGSSLQS